MYLDELKRWHWAVLGLIAGLAAGYAITLWHSDHDSVVRRPLSAELFVAYANVPPAKPRSIRNLVVDPPHDGSNYVTGEVLLGGIYRPFAFYAARPFVASPDVHANSVLDYLQSISPQGRPMFFRNPWWRATWFILSVAAGVGVIVVGGIWPTIVNLILFGSLRRPAPAEDAYKLERFVAEQPVAASQKPQLTDADMDRLHEIEQQIKSSLDGASPVASPADSATATQPGVVQLNSSPLDAPLSKADTESKEYRGEFYPVQKPHEHHTPPKQAFALVELLVVIAIIGLLISLLLPTIRRARESAQVTACASNLRQMGLALQSYLNDNQLMTFWRAENINTDGMEWYGYGGRPSGNANHEQADYFNTVARPLNRYVNNSLNVFRCPCDTAAPWTHDTSITLWPADSQFDWVGNSYNFNANGYPLRPPPRHDGGLDGVRFSAITGSSQTIVFYEACLYWGADWHYSHKANLAFADGHVGFGPMPSQSGQLKWDP